MPTAIMNWRLRSGNAHCDSDRELARSRMKKEDEDVEKERQTHKI